MTDRPTLGQQMMDARWGKVPGKPKNLRADTTLDTVEQAKIAEAFNALDQAALASDRPTVCAPGG